MDEQNTVTQLLEQLAGCERVRRDLERQAVTWEVWEVPIKLGNNLREAQEQVDQIEARLQTTVDATGAEATRQVEPARRAWLEAEITHIEGLLAVRRGNADRLADRAAAHGPHAEPIKLMNDLKAEQQAVAELEARLARAQRRLAGTLQLEIAAPDGQRYEAEAEMDLLVAQLQADFLAGWPASPQEGLVRYALHVKPDGPPLEATQTLTETGVADGVTLYLVAQALTPASPVSLTVQDVDGKRYVAGVRLDTRIGALARDFMQEMHHRGRGMLELLNGPPDRRVYRPLRDDSTLYDERVGNGAYLRLVPLNQANKGAVK